MKVNFLFGNNVKTITKTACVSLAPRKKEYIWLSYEQLASSHHLIPPIDVFCLASGVEDKNKYMNIQIDNIGKKVTADSLAVVFSTYGHVDSSTIHPASTSTDSKRMAFINMPDNGAACKAIEQLHGSFIDGYILCVAPAIPKVSSPFGSIYKWVRHWL